MRKLAGLALSVCSVAMIFPDVAWAQSETQDPSANQSDDIVVTARRRPETAQSVPIAISAFDDRALTERSITTLNQVAKFSPGVTIDQGAAASGGNHSTSIFVRGLGQSDPSAFADPAVAVYIDNVYFGRAVGSLLDIADIGRVEVLKGPQGTLFGRNTMGGAISVFSRMPEGKPGGFARFSVGTYGQMDFQAAAELPLSDTLAARLSLSTRNRDGYAISRVSGQDQDDVDSFSVRGVLRWRPSSNLDLTLIGDYSDIDESAQGLHLLTAKLNPAAPFAGNLSVINISPLGAPSTPYFAFDNRWQSAGTDHNFTAPNPVTGLCNCSIIQAGGITGTMTWTVAPATTVTSVTAYRKLHSINSVDLDGSPLDLQSQTVESHQNQFSQEMRLSGTLWDGRVNYLFGAYYLREAIDETLNVRIGNIGSLSIVRQDNAVRPVSTTLAFFTQESVTVTDGLQITVGVRWNEDRKVVPAQAFNLNTGAFILAPTVKREQWRSVTPKASIEFRPAADVLAYASYSKGFKSGGFDYSISTSSFLPFGPEQVDQYEIGFKSDLFGRLLRLNVAAYYSDYKDLQLRATIQPGSFGCPSTVIPSCTSIVNASTVHIKGVEADLVLRPKRGLQFFASGSFNHNAFVRIDPVLLATNAASPTSGANFNSRLPRTPKWTGTVGAQYEFELASIPVHLRADYAYRSRQFLELANNPTTAQNGYGLLSARVAIDVIPDRLTLSLEGQNLTNERYKTTAILSTAFNYAAAHYGTPRTWTASARFEF